MADQLQFRGGTTSEVSAASVASREIIIDTDTEQIAVGTSKKKTVMEDSSGNVIVGGDIRMDSARIFTAGNPGPITSYAAMPALNLISYGSNTGSPYTKTSAIVANGDGTVPSELELWTKSNGSSGPAKRVLIDSEGVVNIGTTAAADTDVKLQVAFTGGNSYIQIKGADSTGTAGIKFGRNSAPNRAGIDWSASDDALKFRTGGTNERLRIDSSGNVLIGGTLPSAPNIELKADGSITAAGNIDSGDYSGTEGTRVYSTGRLFINRASSNPETDDAIKLLRSSSSVFTVTGGGSITAAGDVKIGGTLPSAPNITLASSGAITAVGLIYSNQSDISTPAFLGRHTVTGGKVFEGKNASAVTTSQIFADGSATFAGDVTCSDNSKGLVLKSPDGTSFRLSVANDGTLSASSI